MTKNMQREACTKQVTLLSIRCVIHIHTCSYIKYFFLISNLALPHCWPRDRWYRFSVESSMDEGVEHWVWHHQWWCHHQHPRIFSNMYAPKIFADTPHWTQLSTSGGSKWMVGFLSSADGVGAKCTLLAWESWRGRWEKPKEEQWKVLCPECSLFSFISKWSLHRAFIKELVAVASSIKPNSNRS